MPLFLLTVQQWIIMLYKNIDPNTSMDLGNSLVVSGFSILLVFFALVMIMVLIKIMSVVFSIIAPIEKKK